MKWLRQNRTKFIAFVFLTALAILWVIPIIWTIFTSFKPEVEIQTIGYKFTPIKWTLENFIEVIKDSASAPIIKWFKNSLLISITHTTLMLLITSMSAYAYARLKFKGRNIIFWALMATMMFPNVINLIPTYKIVQTFGWIDSLLAVIIPGLGGVFNIYLIRQFLLGIPKDFDEAAMIDGASEWQIFSKIVIPLSKPVLTVVALFSFTGSWNDFLWPSIVINDIEKMPLTPGLKLLQGVYDIEIAHLMSATVIAIIPPVIIYIFAQKYFLKGLALTSGVKG